MARRKGKLCIVSGPSGSGKSSLIAWLLKEVPAIRFPTSATTRPRRPGEKNGVHYHFLTRRAFARGIKEGRFLEYADVYGHLYGTLKATVEAGLERGDILLKDVDVQGAAALMQALPRARRLSIFIVPPSLKVLRERLKGRGTESRERFATRVREAEKELEARGLFDHIVVNGDFEKACRRFRAILRPLVG